MTSRIRPLAALSCAAFVSTASLAGVDYSLAGSFAVADGLFTAGALADGRLIGIRADGALLAQTAVHSSSWAQVGAIDAALLNSFGPSFIAVNPGGSRIAIGDGNFGAGASVLLVDIASLDPMSVSNATSVAMANFAGHWSSDDTLYVTGAPDFAVSVVTELDASTLAARVVVNDVQGGSGGVVTDGTWLYTSNGFDFDEMSGSATGEVRAFRLSDFTGSPLSFEMDGLAVADALSAGSLAIDSLGNLVIGGGDFTGESGFFSVIGAGDIAGALLGAGIVPDSLETMLDPSNGTAFGYSVLFNSATGETIAIADGVAYRYTVPAPASAVALVAFAGFLPRRRRTPAPLPVARGVRWKGLSVVLLALSPLSFAGDSAHWFASEVIDFTPAPGQFVNNASYNNSADALGAPVGGSLGEPATSNIVSLGGFGGSITLKFAATVWNDPCNPFGVDAIVFGNASYVGGDPRRRFAEAAHIEISYDANHNGLADDAWYIIRGSSLPASPNDSYRMQDWDNNTSTPTPPANVLWYPSGIASPSYTTGAYELPPMFAANIVTLSPGATEEAVWGYADFTPTLGLPNGADSSVFYSTPDDPFAIGITPGSAGGDAFDIAWAVDPLTGAPAYLPGFDFIRITTAVDAIIGPVGEISAEIAGVSRVRSRITLEGDATGDGVVNFADLNAVLAQFGTSGELLEGDTNCDGVVNFADLNAVLANFGSSGDRGSSLGVRLRP